MKPFEIINDLNTLKNYLQNDKKYSKRKELVQKEIDRVDKISKVVSVILNEEINPNIFSTLILMALSLKIKLETKQDINAFYDIELFLKGFGQEIRDGAQLKAMEVADQMKYPYEQRITHDFDKEQDLNRVGKLMKRIPTTDENLEILREFINILKTDVTIHRPTA